MGRDTFHHTRLLKNPSNPVLNTSTASTTSLGNLFQCLTTLIVKNVFLISNLNLPTFSLKPLLFVVSLHALVKKSLSSFLVGLLQGLEGCYKVSPQSSLLQTEQPQLSQPVLRGEVFQPSDRFCGPPLDSLQQVHVYPVLRVPELEIVLQVGSHQNITEGQNHIPSTCWPCFF